MGTGGTVAPSPAPAPRKPEPAGANLTPTAPQEPPSAPLAQPAPAADLKSFDDVVAIAEAQRDLKLKRALLEQVRLVHFRPGNIEINPLPTAPRELAQELMRKLRAWTGRVWIVAVSDEKGAEPLGQQRRAREASEIESIREHPQVREVLQHFPDARIAAVRPRRSHRGRARDQRGRSRPAQGGWNQPMKNFASMMKQAQELQGRMAEMQAEMERALVEGRSGGGLVVLTLNGKGEMVGIKLDPSLLGSEDAEILEDLIIAAHTDAKAKVEVLMKEKMQSIAGGLPLPPGLKLF